jgi:hypothetical protein
MHPSALAATKPASLEAQGQETTMGRTIILPKSVGMTIAEARQTLRHLGLTGIELHTIGRSTPRTPHSRRARTGDPRGARFLRSERVPLLA